MLKDYEKWEKWLKTEGEAIHQRLTVIIAPEDEELVIKNVKCPCDAKEYDEYMEESGINWHSGGRILESNIPFSNFSEETKKNIKRKFYDDIEYQMEYNTFKELEYLEKWERYKILICGIREDDIVSIQRDDEWGLFIELYRPNAEFCYSQLKADGDPVAEKFWDVDYHSVPRK